MPSLARAAATVGSPGTATAARLPSPTAAGNVPIVPPTPKRSSARLLKVFCTTNVNTDTPM